MPSHSQINVMRCIKLLCVNLCQSVFVRITILMLSLYFGGLIWFFYGYSNSWTQLYYLCHQSSTEFLTTVYYDYQQYSPFYTPLNTQTNHLNQCKSNDITTCNIHQKLQNQKPSWSKSTIRNRDYCIKNVRDEEYEERKISQTLIDRHKHNALNKLLFDAQSSEEGDNTLSMLLSSTEIRKEFPNEYTDCASQSSIYLTDFAPVLGFHVLCFYHYPQYSQTLVIAYQHGYKKNTLPSVPYKNRKRCIVRSIDENKDTNTRHKLNTIPNGTYYVTNECERLLTPKEPNPKYILIAIKNMKGLRRHLQNNLINDIASYDQYTIEGMDISKEFVKDNIDPYQRYFEPTFDPTIDPTKSPETEKLYDRLKSLREEKKMSKKQKHQRSRSTMESVSYHAPYTQKIDPFSDEKKVTNDDNNTATVIAQYKKNPFSLYYPSGESVSYYLSTNDIFNIGTIVFMFEGGRFMWPGIERGHIITLTFGPNLQLVTLNMRPLIFEIKGLITAGEVEYIGNKSLPRFNRSEVGLNEEKKVSESRTCESAWLFGEHDIIVNSLKNRCQRILQIPMTHMEDMEVVRYKKGQRFDMHYDAFQQHDAVSSQSQILLHGGFKNRIATVLYYLSNVDKDSAGYTVFPRYDLNLDFDDYGVEKHGTEIILSEKCCNDTLFNEKYGLRIKPKSGKTILFYNMLPNGELDPAALHGGCKLQSGQKWAANQWIWNRPFS